MPKSVGAHNRKKLRPAKRTPVDAVKPELVINRELSWLDFNARVLAEAVDERNPLLERIKFLAIFASNLDEFFMIRVSGLRRLLLTGSPELSPDGMSPAEQLDAIRRTLVRQLARQNACWEEELQPKLRTAGITIVRYAELPDAVQTTLRAYFEREIFPVLTPLAFDPAHPFPHISNLSLNLAVVVKDSRHNEHFARVKVPDLFPRLVQVPGQETDQTEEDFTLSAPQQVTFVWLEDIIAANLDLLFAGMQVVSAYPFRVTRDADFDIEEDEASDLMLTVEESVEMRQFGSGVRLEVDRSMPPRIRELLVTNLGIPSYLVYAADSPIGMADLMQLTKLDRPELKDPVFFPVVPQPLQAAGSLFPVLRKRDVLLYHPYDSFNPVIDFIREAARDPQVLAIKQTLYRIGPNSPIVDALLEARDNGKQVAVLVELKARFDEENNIAWARKLEQEGVHVVYGLLGLKTHAKMALVVRREADGLVRYVHMSTGNYNPVTARIYADIGLFTTDPAIGADISDLFNALTGYSQKEQYRKLLVGPVLLREELLTRIKREITRHQQHGDGYLAFKMNSLVDSACIQALYQASQAGVKVDLQVRGICCLRPDVPELSEHITVTSVVGRFLEHARIYYFRNGGEEEVFLGSADLMPRNLDRRVEILFPVDDPAVKRALIDDILTIHLRDNRQNWRLLADGRYERMAPGAEETETNSQYWLLQHWSRRGGRYQNGKSAR